MANKTLNRRNGDKSNVANQRNSETSNGTSDNSKRTDDKQEESLLEKFFIAQLKDIYYAEQKIVSSLPKMQEAANSAELKDAFEEHLHQSERHVKRLEKAFEIIGIKAAAEKCEAIEGITKEAQKIISETTEGTATRDAALIIAAQKVEHYEIATYGGLVQLAITVGLREVGDLLDKTLKEEEDTDRLLTNIAEKHINIEAEEETKYSWSDKRSSKKKEAQPAVAEQED